MAAAPGLAGRTPDSPIARARRTMGMEAVKVSTRKDLKEFIDLPWMIYRDFPHWVPPLKAEVEKMVTPGKYPFWQHAERELFVVRKEGQAVGRIAAIRDDNHDRIHQEKAGFFGFFECAAEYEIARVLFDAAKDWCREKGCIFLRGPASPSANDEYGFLLEGFDLDPVIMMPYTPPYYLEFSERYGFPKVKDLYALWASATAPIPERIEKVMQRAKKNSPFTIRTIDPKNFRRDVQSIKSVYNGAWEKNWGFVPMTDEEMDLTAESMKPFYDPNLIIIAEYEGKPVGIGLTVPNINEVLKRLNGKMNLLGILKFLWLRRKVKSCRSLIGGCLPEYRRTGLIAEIFYETVCRARSRYEWCELGWNLEDNDLINRFDVEIGGQIYKKYRLYQMPV
jgi:hypothetical protein